MRRECCGDGCVYRFSNVVVGDTAGARGKIRRKIRGGVRVMVRGRGRVRMRLSVLSV